METVFWKEMRDHFSSWRFILLVSIILLAGFGFTLWSGQTIKDAASDAPTEYVFLLLLTLERAIFSVATFLGFVGPFVGIILGFDMISGEYARGTLSRVLSQPIYRDSLINGKFLAGLATIAVLWFSILFIFLGLGTSLMGFPPNAEELWRLLIFTLVGIVYVSFWLALAMLFSLLFQRTITAALAALAAWLFLTLFIPILAQALPVLIVPTPSTPEQQALQFNIERMTNRVSPVYIYSEIVRNLLNPRAHLIQMMSEQVSGVLATPLSLGQSLLLVWPQVCTLLALLAICFGISYIKFMRDEIRA
ncbi:MAG TPA: ABC transporter permease [Candidatus Acidoferrales bacterium]|nr:ABC transporter permease [Candidatus Acidoferrales bacterium]